MLFSFSRKVSAVKLKRFLIVALLIFSYMLLFTACEEPGLIDPIDSGSTPAEEPTDPGSTTPPEDNTPITFKVTYALEVPVESGAVPVDSSTYNTGDTVTVLDNTGLLVDPGNDFTGWRTTDGVVYQAGDTFNIVFDTTLYPVWSYKTYIFTHVLNFDEHVTLTGQEERFTIQSPSMDTIIPSPSREGLTFAGWEIERLNEETGVIDKTVLETGVDYFFAVYNGTAPDHRTLTAKWTKSGHPLNWHLDGGTAGQVYPPAISANLAMSSLTPPTKDGFTFLGWYDKDGGKVDTLTYTAGTYTELYAKWHEGLLEYNIAYNLDGGTITSGSVNYDTSRLPFNLPVPRKGGAIFDGWYVDAGLTGTAVTDIPAGSTGDKTFYAKWKTYQIGDTGPAGGLIFYVNSNSVQDGWTYLEAAPKAAEKKMSWGGINILVGEEVWGGEVGKGLANTEFIVHKLGNSGEYAAKYCLDLVHNGFDDWFLPSFMEAEFIRRGLYGWLGSPNIGDFDTYAFLLTSTEKWAGSAFIKYLWNGLGIDYYGKHFVGTVRPVRRF